MFSFFFFSLPTYIGCGMGGVRFQASAYTESHWKVSQELVTAFEMVLYGQPLDTGAYRTFIDEASFIDYLLIVVELGGNSEALQGSAHLHYTPDQRLGMGPVWDLVTHLLDPPPRAFWGILRGGVPKPEFPIF